jgi:hypothetical protein
MKALGPSLMLAACCAAGPAAGAELVTAAAANDGRRAIALIDAGADVTAAEPNGTTPLHWAAHHGELELVESLLRAGADAAAANAYGATPMSEAAIRGDLGILQALLDAGADVESPNADGQTGLMVLARGSNVAAARLLLERGANVNAAEAWRGQTALMWAAAQSQPQMMRVLLERGADADARSLVNRWERQVSAEPRAQWRPAGGWTALLYAARHGCVACVTELAAAKANLDLANEDGVTALIVAITNLHFDTAKKLLEHGANPNKWDWRGRTPLYMAVDMNTLPHGGWPDRPSTDETTSLELIELLLSSGANPNAQLKLNPTWRATQDDRGKDLLLSIGTTPLLRAAKGFDSASISLLLAHGAKPDLPNIGAITRTQIGGVTPLMAAAGLDSRPTDTRGVFDSPDVQQRAIEALRLLLAGGAQINAGDDHGRTALHAAASWGWMDVASFLVDNGADLFAEDADGVSPVDAALGRMRAGRLAGSAPAFEETAAALQELAAKQDERGGSAQGTTQ